MTTETLYPNAVGDSSQNTPTGDTPGWKCVDEAASDDDSTYVWDSDYGNWDTDTYSTEDGSDLGTITKVIVHSICRRYIQGGSTTSSYSRTVLRIDGSNNYGTENDMGDSYTDYSTTYTTKPGGGSWTWTDINNLQCGVSLESGDTSGDNQSHARCTQVWVKVSYTP